LNFFDAQGLTGKDLTSQVSSIIATEKAARIEDSTAACFAEAKSGR
jgi:hypothetical protein